MFKNATSRFSRTVENYIRYRPGYPPALFEMLKNELHLMPHHIVADVGAGTGKSSEPFLELGNQVFAIEPNEEMRHAAESLCAHFPGFISVAGSAEATTLANQSVDFVVAGTAFHWFEPQATRLEFQRILKPDDWVLLVWNVRNNNQTTFMAAYEDFLLNYSIDYEQVSEVYHATSGFDSFFGNPNWKKTSFKNTQTFDFEGLLGRYLSCSYAFPENHPNFAVTKAALRVLFDEHEENGQVKLWYDTTLYYGKLE